jgi:hypothetical protein
MSQPLQVGFLGDRKTTLQVEATLTAEHFEAQGARIAFDHRSRVSLKADFRLDCSLRLSTNHGFSSLLFERLEKADCEIVGSDFILQVLNSRLILRIDYEHLVEVGSWSLEEQGLDVTQPMIVDKRISALDLIRGVKTRSFKGQPRVPELPCFVSVKINLRDPLRMQVADRIEPVEDKAVISTGRPESNRRRF